VDAVLQFIRTFIDRPNNDPACGFRGTLAVVFAGGRLRFRLRSILQIGAETGNKVSSSETDLPN